MADDFRGCLIDTAARALLKNWWGEADPTEHDVRVANEWAEAVVDALQIEECSRTWTW
jgi:hypothetical protein